MTMIERMRALIGHEIYTDFLHAAEADEGIGGVLEEVGTDYLLLAVERDTDNGVVVGDQWFVRLDALADLVHSGDCPTCAVQEAQDLTKNSSPRR